MGFKEMLAEFKERMNEVIRLDTEAKEKGTLINRYIAEPFADGYAYYRITKVNKKTVRVEVITGIGDDWMLPYWGAQTSIDRIYAENAISMRENLDKLFIPKLEIQK